MSFERNYDTEESKSYWDRLDRAVDGIREKEMNDTITSNNTTVIASWRTNKYKTRMLLYIGGIDMAEISTGSKIGSFEVSSRPLNHSAFCQDWDMAVKIAKHYGTEFMELLCPDIEISWPNEPYKPSGLCG